jgi:hypothetical protein
MALGANHVLTSPADGFTLLYAHNSALMITPIFQLKSGLHLPRHRTDHADGVFQPIPLVAGGTSTHLSAKLQLRPNFDSAWRADVPPCHWEGDETPSWGACSQAKQCTPEEP